MPSAPPGTTRLSHTLAASSASQRGVPAERLIVDPATTDAILGRRPPAATRRGLA
jgi:hypothetical protein